MFLFWHVLPRFVLLQVHQSFASELQDAERVQNWFKKMKANDDDKNQNQGGGDEGNDKWDHDQQWDKGAGGPVIEVDDCHDDSDGAGPGRCSWQFDEFKQKKAVEMKDTAAGSSWEEDILRPGNSLPNVNSELAAEWGILISGAPRSYDNVIKKDQIWKILNCQCKEKAGKLLNDASPGMQEIVLLANPNFIQQTKYYFKAAVFQSLMESVEPFTQRKTKPKRWLLIHCNGGRHRSPATWHQHSYSLCFFVMFC